MLEALFGEDDGDGRQWRVLGDEDDDIEARGDELASNGWPIIYDHLHVLYACNVFLGELIGFH